MYYATYIDVWAYMFARIEHILFMYGTYMFNRDIYYVWSIHWWCMVHMCSPFHGKSSRKRARGLQPGVILSVTGLILYGSTRICSGCTVHCFGGRDSTRVAKCYPAGPSRASWLGSQGASPPPVRLATVHLDVVPGCMEPLAALVSLFGKVYIWPYPSKLIISSVYLLPGPVEGARLQNHLPA